MSTTGRRRDILCRNALALLCFFVLLLAFFLHSSASAANTIVRFDIQRGTNNSLGPFEVELFDSDKPETVRNFLLYVRSGAYSNMFLHRCVPGFVVQGGGFTVTNFLSTNSLSTSYQEVTNYGRLANEFATGPKLSNVVGTIAMAKIGEDPNSASSQWFFNLVTNTHLDTQNGGFTVFGRMLSSTNSSNVIAHFNSLSKPLGTINNMGSAFPPFSDVPMAVGTNRAPQYRELYPVQISILNQTNAPGQSAPTVRIVTPPPNTTFSNQPVVFSGTATDDTGIARVMYRIGTNAAQNASGTTNWQFSLSPPQNGLNTITMESIDWDGNRSAAASVTFLYIPQIPLALQIQGSGRVTGAVNGQYLQVGTYQTLTAIPNSGNIFHSWTGTFTSSVPTITFLVPTDATNVSLTAKFISEPLPRLAGTYKGLFRSSGTGPPSAINAGQMTLQLETTGDFDGTILHAGGSYTYTGRFDANGDALIQGVVGGFQRTITLELQKLNAEGLITGTLNGGNDLRLERIASTNSYGIPTGKYTFAIPPAAISPADQLNPAGFGFGSCTVDAYGTLTLNGRLCDGQVFSSTAPLTRLQHWPIYINLFNGRGVVLGWVTNGNGNLDGGLHYIKGFKATDPTYPAGFSNQVAFFGSRYTLPQVGERVVDWVHGLASLAGPFQIGISNIVKLTSDNVLIPMDENQNSITWTLDPVTGMLTGTFVDLWSGTTRTLRGAVLKRSQAILGQFVDRGTAGSLVLSRSPFLVTQTVASVTQPEVLTALKEGGYLKFMTNVDVTFTEPLTLAYDLALDANSNSVVLRGGQTTRLLRVLTNHVLFARGVTFADGKIVGTAGANTSPPLVGGEARAAGIMNIGGLVALTNCVLTNFVCQGGLGGKDKLAGLVAPGGRGVGAAIGNFGGRIILNNCQLMDNVAQGGAGNVGTNSAAGCGTGGAVYSEGGECFIEGSTFLRNTAAGGPARTESGALNRAGEAAGGALAVYGARLQVSNSVFRANLATGPNALTNNQTVGGAHGGAIYMDTNSLATIDWSTIADNVAVGGNSSWGQPSGIARGGGVLNLGALQLRRSTIEQNTATSGSNGIPGSASGGGVASLGILVLDACTMSYNVAKGGSSYTNGWPAAGGGLFCLTGSFWATNSTFAFNSATADSAQDVHGGGIMLISNAAVMVHTTVAFNSTSTTNSGGIEQQESSLRFRSSIVSSNMPRNLVGAAVDDGYNLCSDASLVVATNLFSTNNINPMLGPLTTNGGPTRTMSLQAASPARDLLPTSATPPMPGVDQRGTPRPQPQGGRGDAGAVEITNNELPPFIVTNPAGGNIRAGTNFTFQTVVTGAAPLSYSWLSNDVPVLDATDSILQLTNIQTFAPYIDYRVAVSNRFGAATSQIARLTVDSRPLITTQPTNIVIAPGAAVSFTVVAGGPSLGYAWYHDGVPVPGPGATNSTLAFASAVAGMQGAYRVVITNFAGSVTSQVATLTFSALALSFIQPPTNTTVFEGQNGVLSAIVSGIQPIGYSWLLGFTPIVNATNQDLRFAPAAMSDQGTYRLLITNAYLSITSAPAVLTVLRQPLLSIQVEGTNVLISSRGTPNRTTHLLQATSLNAQAWTPVATNIAPSSGTSVWTRPLIQSENRFYRVLMP